MTTGNEESWDIYARLSMDRTGAGKKVADQVADCTEYIEKVLKAKVGEVYTDNDISATNGKRRPDFERLLSDKSQRLVVWHQDRLLRVSKDLERVLDVGTVVHQVTAGTLDLATPTGRAVARTIAAWSTYEGEHKAERQRAANRKSRAEGNRWWSRRPFGYEMDLSQRKVEADALRQAYSDLLSGSSSYAIAQDWNEQGLRQDNGNLWEGRRVSMLLGNVRNIGHATYHGEVVGQGRWEPIVDEGTFYAAQAILTDPKRRVGGAPRYSLLSGPLKCGRCSGFDPDSPYPSERDVQALESGTLVPMNRWRGKNTNGNPFDRYRCQKCQYMVDTAWAEKAVKAALFTYMRDNATVTSPATETVDTSRLEKRKADLADAYAREDVDLAQMIRATKALDEQIEAARAEMAAQAAVQARRLTMEDFTRMMHGDMTTDQQRELIASIWTIVAVGKHPDKKLHLYRHGQTDQRTTIGGDLSHMLTF